MTTKMQIARSVLKWYDKNARSLPWRVPPLQSKLGIRPNPYHVWISEIMLQQTTVKAVKPYYETFIKKWPSIKKLASAKNEEIMETWAGLGYYSRARNLINCAKLLNTRYQALLPQDEATLLKLPGVGPYTAAAIRTIAFNKNANVMDGNIDRIVARLYAINSPIGLSKNLIKLHAATLIPKSRFGDYAQALMDLGSTICKPKNPQCIICPIKSKCSSYKQGMANLIPYPMEKRIKPIRRGYAFITSINNNSVILERRATSGLLGGMLCFPTTKWEESKEAMFSPPFKANWHILDDTVYHTFSHFHLELSVAYGVVPHVPSGYLETPFANFNRKSLPTVMRKVFDVGFKNQNQKLLFR